MNKKTIIKAIISLIAVLIIAKTISAESITDYNLDLNFLYIFFILFMSLVNMSIITYKWQIIIHKKKIVIKFSKLLKLYYFSNLFGQIAPTIVGDSMRAYHLSRYTNETMNSITSVLWVRVTGFLSQMLLVLISLPFVMTLGYKFVIITAILIINLFIIYFVIISYPQKVVNFITKFSQIYKKFKILNYAEEITNNILEYSVNRKFIFFTLILSILDHLTRIISAYFVSLSLGLSVHFFYFLVFIPISMIVQMIPISLGGFGVREGTYIFLFSKVGLTTMESLTLSIFMYIMTVVVYLPGLYFFIVEKFHPKLSGQT